MAPDIGTSIGIAALLVSGVALIVSVLAWRESNRPLVTARVTTAAGGNVAVMLNLLVENTGTRPAKNIELAVDPAILDSALDPSLDDEERRQIADCFGPTFRIPVLANGASVTNAFGLLHGSPDAAWRLHARIPITLAYEDLDGRRFKHALELFMIDASGFAGTFYR